MTRTEARLSVIACAILMASCGGGGGGGGGGNNPPPVPTVTLSATPTSVARGGMVTLTWSSTNAASCTASNGWSGSRATSGTLQVGPISAETTYALACSNNGGTPVSASTTIALTVPPTPTGLEAVTG